MKQKLIVIAGPTAVGKTAVAIELALRLNGEIISADSMQIYKGMDIGTAKPSMEERRGVHHHLIDICEPDADYSAASFQLDALRAIEDVSSRGKLPIVAGGTGLYINSLVYDLDFTATAADAELRAKLEAEYDALGAEALHSRMAAMDPAAGERIHVNDKKRIVRRLEVLLSGDRSEYDFLRESSRFDLCIFGLTRPRELLYESIARRVDDMLESGLEGEARALVERYGSGIPSMQAIGYKEFVQYFKGEITLDEARELIVRNTRRFAKRQLTWFKRDKRIFWYDLNEFDCLEAVIYDIIKMIGVKKVPS